MSVESFQYGKAKKLSANKFKRQGCTFKGWAKSKALAKKGAVAYKNKMPVKNLTTTGKTIHLYAVWAKPTVHGKVQLWEGGPNWVTTNIGAEEPEDSGLYFWWGDTMGYRREGDAWIASDGSSQNFSFDSGNTPTYGKYAEDLQSEGWTTSAGVLAPAHDAAHVHWGGDWRMPTQQELSVLSSNCDWTWTTRNGVNGYVVRGRGAYSSASIFLPAAGDGDGTSLYFAGSYGDYWSSVPYSVSDDSWSLSFNSDYHGVYDGYGRFYGQSVRPVLGFTE